MRSDATYNFHLPLPAEVRAMLREEVELSGRPATAIARDALAEWLRQRRRTRMKDEIAAYASAQAGTAADLDENLESAGIELLVVEASHETG